MNGSMKCCVLTLGLFMSVAKVVVFVFFKAKEWTGTGQRRQRALAFLSEEEKQEFVEHVL